MQRSGRVATVQVVDVAMTWRARIERKWARVVRGEAVKWVRIKSYSHRVFCLGFIARVWLLVRRLKSWAWPVHGVDERRLRTFVSVHRALEIYLTLVFLSCGSRSTQVQEEWLVLRSNPIIYSLQFHYYYNTLFPFSINDLELIKSISSQKIKAAGYLIVMKTVKFRNELRGEVSSIE